MMQATVAVANNCNTSLAVDESLTHFDFQNRVFAAPGACFMLTGNDRKPAFRVDMGGFEAFVDIEALQKQFSIASDSHDGALIKTAVAGLQYVQTIRRGDKIPNELLDGSASWSVSAQHMQTAMNRVHVQLLSWLSRDETVISDATELEMFLAQIENKEKLRAAFREAAVAMGLTAEESPTVIGKMETLAREISYIEALRDRYRAIPALSSKLEEVRRAYAADPRMRDEIRRITLLMQKATDEYMKLFAEVDAQTGEIISALKFVDRQIGYIRDKRNELHQLMMQWDPLLADWTDTTPQRSHRLNQMVGQVYRFLAQRFSSGKSLLSERQKTQQRAKSC